MRIGVLTVCAYGYPPVCAYGRDPYAHTVSTPMRIRSAPLYIYGWHPFRHRVMTMTHRPCTGGCSDCEARKGRPRENYYLILYAHHLRNKKKPITFVRHFLRITVMKIIAVGWNYMEHNRELNFAERPAEPAIFMKPETALLKDNRPFFLPDFSDEVHYETEVIFRINKVGKNIPEKFAHRYYGEVGVGIDFTARDVQQRLREAGNPWEICKSFDYSAAVSKWVPVEDFDDVHCLNFHLDINGKTVQRGNTAGQIFNIDRIIACVSRYFMLKTGDIIFTGTPAGVGKVNVNDRLQAYLEDRKMLDFAIK